MNLFTTLQPHKVAFPSPLNFRYIQLRGKYIRPSCDTRDSSTVKMTLWKRPGVIGAGVTNVALTQARTSDASKLGGRYMQPSCETHNVSTVKMTLWKRPGVIEEGVTNVAFSPPSNFRYFQLGLDIYPTQL